MTDHHIQHRAGKIVLMLVLAALCLFTLQSIRTADNSQFDFRIFYQAVQNKAKGINPYQPERIPVAAAQPGNPGFVYPPYVLKLFAPFTRLEIGQAATLYLVLHTLAAVALGCVWLKFLGSLRDVYFFPFVVLAFNLTLLLDFQAGNISVFEQLLIWLGFLAFLKGKDGWFCLCILAAASFKLIPVVLLVLLLVRPNRRRLVWFGAAVIAGGLGLVAAYAMQPVLFSHFLSRLVAIGHSPEHGTYNPALLPLVHDLAQILVRHGLNVPDSMELGIYGVGVAAVVVISGWAWHRARLSGQNDLDRLAIVLVCFVYAMTLPRFKDYSFILLLAPAYYIIKSSVPISSIVPWLLLAMVPVVPPVVQGLGTLMGLAQQYLPLLTAAIFWGLLCRRLLSQPAPVRAASTALQSTSGAVAE